MLDATIRRYWDRLMRPVGAAGRRINPDFVTVAGVLVQGVGAYLIARGAVVAGGLVTIGAGIADVLDGAIAKARGTPGRFGALLDSTTDRLSDALVFAAIVWLYGIAPDLPERDEPWVAAVALVAMVTSFLVSYVKARAEGLGLECNVGIAERAERFLIMVAGLVFDQVPIAVSILAILAVVTLFQRLLHVRAQARVAR